MTGSILQAVNVFSSSQSTGGILRGRIEDNFIGNAAVPNSGSTGGGGISAVIQGQTDATLLIDSNTIRQTNGDSRAISVAVRGPANPLAGTLGANTVVSDITITNNNVIPGAAPSGFPLSTISVEADNQTGADNKAPTVRTDIRGNTVPAGTIFDLTSAHLQFYEYDAAGAHGIGQLVNTTGAATANQQLSNTNTGSVDSFGIALNRRTHRAAARSTSRLGGAGTVRRIRGRRSECVRALATGSARAAHYSDSPWRSADWLSRYAWIGRHHVGSQSRRVGMVRGPDAERKRRIR